MTLLGRLAERTGATVLFAWCERIARPTSGFALHIEAAPAAIADRRSGASAVAALNAARRAHRPPRSGAVPVDLQTLYAAAAGLWRRQSLLEPLTCCHDAHRRAHRERHRIRVLAARASVADRMPERRRLAAAAAARAHPVRARQRCSASAIPFAVAGFVLGAGVHGTRWLIALPLRPSSCCPAFGVWLGAQAVPLHAAGGSTTTASRCAAAACGRRETRVPATRVQHLDLKRGPLRTPLRPGDAGRPHRRHPAQRGGGAGPRCRRRRTPARPARRASIDDDDDA